mmetsp:Transcript_81151/g.210817  ORF Transcript_81151/g.210817 Transcript_81151/m.210817 type:complete len:99 (-) Transcript_81151:591-887(-)
MASAARAPEVLGSMDTNRLSIDTLAVKNHTPDEDRCSMEPSTWTALWQSTLCEQLVGVVQRGDIGTVDGFDNPSSLHAQLLSLRVLVDIANDDLLFGR